jgi:hypothetical protein
MVCMLQPWSIHEDAEAYAAESSRKVSTASVRSRDSARQTPRRFNTHNTPLSEPAV